MKKMLTGISVTIILFACNGSKDKTGSTADEKNVENHAEHAGQATAPVLNNAAKWKVDSTTSVNVALLQVIVADAKQTAPGNYVQTATRLEDGLNKLVKECRMQGAAHDALHQWLEPLMEKTNTLKKAGSAETAAVALSQLADQLNLFTQYFEK